jgi:DNA-binding NtrC family response regulator
MGTYLDVFGEGAGGPFPEVTMVYNETLSVSRRIDMFQLTAKSGMAKGACWTIEDRPLVIGRGSGCDVRIPDTVVSRQHCEIARVGDVINLRDLGSVNPVLVNGKPVTTCTLQVGDEVRVGRAVFFITSSKMAERVVPEDQQDNSGDTLAEQDSVFLSSRPPEEGAQVQPQTDKDLNDLFRLSRSLSRLTTEEALIRAVGDAVNARFRPDRSWLLLLRAQGDELIEISAQGASAISKAKPPPHERLMSTLTERRGILVFERVARGDATALRCTMAAPIFLGAHRIGALAFQHEQEQRACGKSDLHFFVALAHITAPFFKAIERIEELETENRRLRLAGQKLTRLVGSGKAMARVNRVIGIVASTLQPVLILGATGTGKELVAGLIHELSDRAQGPLVTVNCAAIPRDLFESEFFGHEKGAFTGAATRRTGLLEQSHGGTLFLDEIGDLSIEHQARILRAVETGRFRRVGGEEEISADFRVIAATNKNLPSEIKRGAFREDLYHRLNAVEIDIPPLTQRRCDIPELARHFLEAAHAKTKGPERRLSPSAIEYLVKQPWPGNVRELKNTIEVANTFCRGDVIDVDDLRAVCCVHDTEAAPLPLMETERIHIMKALEYTDGNMMATARLLGIARTTLYNKLSQHGLRS